MSRLRAQLGLALLAGLFGCAGTTTVSNPFLAYTEAFGIPIGATSDDQAAAQGVAAEVEFRRPTTVTFRNNHAEAEANVSFAAWVNTSSIRSTAQEDALLTDGYVELLSEIKLGTAFTLPVGTFVYNGSGAAGATPIRLGPAQGEGDDAEPATEAITLISPDVILAFVQEPVSCESVAFYYSVEGEPLTSIPAAGGVGPFAGSTLAGAFKTLAMVDAYECDPFRPGLFIKLGGGAQEANEYTEGANITFDFSQFADANGNFGLVTIGTGTEETTP